MWYRHSICGALLCHKWKQAQSNRAKLQDYNNCSIVSATLRQNMLTMMAPVQEKKAVEQIKSQVIPVTEHD
jgi:hypothetical protein